jgi:hypothetical protein
MAGGSSKLRPYFSVGKGEKAIFQLVCEFN